MGAQGYQRFPISKPVVGQNIALGAVPAFRASIQVYMYQVSASLAHSSFKFIFSTFLQIFNWWNTCVLSSESEFVLVVGIHFVSP